MEFKIKALLCSKAKQMCFSKTQMQLKAAKSAMEY